MIIHRQLWFFLMLTFGALTVSCSSESTSNAFVFDGPLAVNGYVSDSLTLTGLQYVQIEVDGHSPSFSTDETGYYDISGLHEGTHEFRFLKPTYATQTHTLTLNENATLDNFYMDTIDTLTDDQQWRTPIDDEAVVIFFSHLDTLRLDSALAGKIQYRLDIARTVDPELFEFKPLRTWRAGYIIIQVPDTLYTQFDESTIRFNHPALDSLLSTFDIISANKLLGFIEFEFSETMNMPLVAEYFLDIPEVWVASAGYLQVPLECHTDIEFYLEDNVYSFLFMLEGACPGSTAPWNWHVRVKGTRAALIRTW